MSRTLSLEVSEPLYHAIEVRARAAAQSAAELAAATLALHFGGGTIDATVTTASPRGRLERLFGSVDLGYATGTDNEAIDADPAREYANNHETT